MHPNAACSRNQRTAEIVKSKIGHLKSRISDPPSFLAVVQPPTVLGLKSPDSRWLILDFKISKIVAKVREVDRV